MAKDMTQEAFMNRYNQLMTDRKLSQNQLSKITGIAPTALTRFKNGTGYPNLKTAVLLSDAFEVSLDYLIKGEEHGDICSFDSSFTEYKNIIDDIDLSKMDTGYVNSLLYCPSYCNYRHSGISLDEFEEKARKTINSFSKVSADPEYKERMLNRTLKLLVENRIVLEDIALYLYSTDSNILRMLGEKNGTYMMDHPSSESACLGRTVRDMESMKALFHVDSARSRANKHMTFLEV